MENRKYVVYLIDDDPSVRCGLKRLLDTYGYDARIFASAGEFLAAGLPGNNACIVIDVIMPEMDGLQLQKELTRLECKAPVIFITALNDPDIRERAKRAGAVGFFQKPVDSDALLDAIKWALTGRGENAEFGSRKAEG